MSSININNRWSIEPDTQCFIVVETYISENEDGEEQEYENRTYHKTVLQALNKIRREENRECETVEELIENCKKARELDKQEVQRCIEKRDEMNPYATKL